MKKLSYAWRVCVNVIYVAVTLAVLNKLNTRFEIITIASIGILYVTVRNIAFWQYVAQSNFVLGIAKDIEVVKAAVVPDYEPDSATIKDGADQVHTNVVKGYIDLGGLAVISLICLFALIANL
ncbi:MAG: hypothetical protein KF742_06470 [Cryobacterium sp.]|nr:hypothetical protein [Cryobacterium sp.]